MVNQIKKVKIKKILRKKQSKKNIKFRNNKALDKNKALIIKK